MYTNRGYTLKTVVYVEMSFLPKYVTVCVYHQNCGAYLRAKESNA